MLVSFIIPSYNSAHTLMRCLNSIYSLSLTNTEFEVIFVDDCSTDNTIDLINDFLKKNIGKNKEEINNLILLRQTQNNRQGAARNRGMSIAQGDYICFVDSDDTVAEGVVPALRLAIEKRTEMVAIHFAYANERGQITSEKEHLSFAPGQNFTGIELQTFHPYWCSGPWAYVYSKAFLNQSSYPFAEGVLYEDSDFVAAHLYHAKRMVYSPETGYVVHYREGSTTHSNSFKNYSDYLLLGTRMLDLYTKIQQNINQHEKTDEIAQKFANGILEGACWNVTKSVSRLFKLKNGEEIQNFYKRVDSFVNRQAIYDNPLIHKFSNYWSIWSALCIKHKKLSIALNSALSLSYRTLFK